LKQPLPVFPQPRTPARLAPAAASQLIAIAATLGPGGHGEVQRRLAAGERCYTATVEGSLVAYGWVSVAAADIGELGLRFRFAPGEAYVWDCVTVPAFRRRGLYTALLGFISQTLQADGFSRVWIGADLNNLPSRKGILAAGYCHVADLDIFAALNWRLFRVRAAPGAPPGLVDEASCVMLGAPRRWTLRPRQ
jgi:hypothetical protein